MNSSINLIFQKALIAYKQDKFDEAIRLYQEILKTEPTNPVVNYNLALILSSKGKIKEALQLFDKAIKVNPYTEHFWNGYIGALIADKQFEEAEIISRKAIKLKPNFSSLYLNLGVILYRLGRFDEAETSYRKAIALKPDYAEAHNNLGITLKELDRLNEAEISYKKATELKPDYADAFNNLGNVLDDKGDLLAAIDSYKQALNIDPNFFGVWLNIFHPLQGIKLQNSSIEKYLPMLDEKINSKYARVGKSILSYRLNQGSPSTVSYLDETISILSSVDNNFIKNPKNSSSELIKPTLPKKIVAMLVFGRSGTCLMHSLIDGHPEVSTLPSIYFGEFFDNYTWDKIIAGGWEKIADRFIKNYPVLFDASSDTIGRKEGMTNVGKEKDEVLLLDKSIFFKELKQLIDCYDRLDALNFFKLVHHTYERVQKNLKKNLIFYHIHDPGAYARLNFLRLTPNTNWLMMVREPIQNCESWVGKDFHDNNYTSVADKIFQMLFEIDQAVFQKGNSIGVKLEDLKEYPKKTIPALCSWLGIEEKDCLYQMTAQGKKWWGDPSSPDYKDDGMNPFGKTSINRKIGSVFSKYDQFILSTLFYPFSVRFGYAKENLKQFKNDLLKIRPMIDQMFDFEKKIIQHTKIDKQKFIKSGPYLYLRSGMIERWNTLNKFHTYPNMLNPLKIDYSV